MRSVRSDALIRIFITVLHLEDGDLDYSKQEVAEQSHGGGVAGRVDVAEAASVTPTRRADGTVQTVSVQECGGEPEKQRVTT